MQHDDAILWKKRNLTLINKIRNVFVKIGFKTFSKTKTKKKVSSSHVT
jgi:hypothetical protein